jgi:hypothetical protein
MVPMKRLPVLLFFLWVKPCNQQQLFRGDCVFLHGPLVTIGTPSTPLQPKNFVALLQRLSDPNNGTPARSSGFTAAPRTFVPRWRLMFLPVKSPAGAVMRIAASTHPWPLTCLHWTGSAQTLPNTDATGRRKVAANPLDHIGRIS